MSYIIIRHISLSPDQQRNKSKNEAHNIFFLWDGLIQKRPWNLAIKSIHITQLHIP